MIEAKQYTPPGDPNDQGLQGWRRTKIIATLGPASSDPGIMRNLVEAGVNIFRLNFSHGSHQEHSHRVAMVRRLEQETGRPLGIMGDIQGPKFRIGSFAAGPVYLEADQAFRFDDQFVPGNRERVFVPHQGVLESCRPGDRISVDDGKLGFEVVEARAGELVCRVLNSGYISDRKGICFGRRPLNLGCIGEKDRQDIRFCLEQGLDWLAISFVQRAEDLREVRRICEGFSIGIAAKIERSAALNELDAIVAEADAVMVARGDLGIENGIETIPGLQKRITGLCRERSVPCIVATQMLETMIQQPVPTRAEVNDVASAVFDQADAVMLSGETAAGKYPVEAVRVMAKVIEEAEKLPPRNAPSRCQDASNSFAIATAACRLAETATADALVIGSGSGLAIRNIVAERPRTPVIGLVQDMTMARRLTLVWGVRSAVVGGYASTDDLVASAIREAGGLLSTSGSSQPRLVVTGGIPSGNPGGSNFIRLVDPGSSVSVSPRKAGDGLDG